MVYSAKLYDNIHKADSLVAEIIQLLKKTKKNKASSIANIIRYIKSESKDYKKTFTITTNDTATTKDIRSAVEKNFADGVVNTKDGEKIGVIVQGE